MALDPLDNFVRGNTSAAVDSSQTTIPVADASIFPDPANGSYNLVLWDVDNHPRPDQDPDVEVVRVTGRDTGTDELTVTRGEEGTTGASHPSGSALHLSVTAKMFSDIESRYTAAGEDFDGQGTSSFNNLQSVSTEVANIDQTSAKLNSNDPNQTIPNADFQKIQFTEAGVEDTDVLDADLSNNEIIVQADGTYIISSSWTWNNDGLTAGDEIFGEIRVNGSRADGGQSRKTHNGSNRSTQHVPAIVVNLTAADTISVNVYQESGSDERLAGENTCQLSVVRVGGPLA